MTQTVLIPAYAWKVCATPQGTTPKPPAATTVGKAGRQRALSPEQAAHVRMLRATGAEYRKLEVMFKVSRRTLVQAAQRTGIYAT